MFLAIKVFNFKNSQPKQTKTNLLGKNVTDRWAKQLFRHSGWILTWTQFYFIRSRQINENMIVLKHTLIPLFYALSSRLNGS